jgi:predicted lipoprotein with Yx(FWY)xxD motif
MRPTSRLLSMTGLAAGLLLVAAACSSAAATPSSGVLGASSAPGSTTTLSETTSPSLGTFLTGKDGFTLYYFANDSAAVSACSGSCATAWPPLTVPSGATIQGPADATAGFGTIVRADGTTQVTYDQHPLYYYSGDSAAGDTTGQGYNGIWFVALVSGVVGTQPAMSSGSAMASEPAASPSSPAGY